MMNLWVPKELCDSVSAERVNRILAFGFSERQARFLVHVLVYAGVFLERQYRAFAGIVHGQKTHDFLAKLVNAGYATAITPGALHRGRLFHVQYKPFYKAIGDPDNRHRKPASLGRFVERLMLLDAVLADRRCTWLGPEKDKMAYFAITFSRLRPGVPPGLRALTMPPRRACHRIYVMARRRRPLGHLIRAAEARKTAPSK